MSDDGGLTGRAVINLLFFSLITNVVVMAIAFGIVAGLAAFLNAGQTAAIFQIAGGILLGLTTILTLFRSVLIELLDDLVFG